MSRTVFNPAYLTLLLVAVHPSRAEDGPPPQPQPVPAPLETKSSVKVDGASLEFTPVDVSKKRSSRGELELIEQARATLCVQKSLSVGKTHVPAGDYDVRVEQDDAKAYFLVLEARAAPAREAREPQAPEGEAGESPGPLPPGAKAPLKEDASGEKQGEKKRESVREKTEKKGTGVKGARKEKEKEKPAGNTETCLRAPLKVSACARKGDKLAFEIALRSKGTKIRIVLRAGETQGAALLRFGDGT